MVFFAVSVFMHVLFFLGLIFFQDFERPKPLPPVIQVDLVSFASEPLLETPDTPDDKVKTEDKVETDAVSTKVTPKVEPVEETKRIIPEIKAEISLKTKPKDLKELMAKKKKPKIKKEKIVKKADPEAQQKKKPAKKIKDPKPDRISEALRRLQKKVTTQGKKDPGEKSGANAGYGKKGYTQIGLYKMVIGAAIEQNWAFNDVLAKMDQNLEVRILVKILKSGEIRDIIYETKSGNRYLDESAKKAIKKANPLPQLPAGMYSYDVLIGFTPRGLK
jgi:colicin import membrane protein